MFQKRSLSNLLCLAASKLASATIHNVVMGDTDDFLTKLGLAEDHDTILLPPGNYIFDDGALNFCQNEEDDDYDYGDSCKMACPGGFDDECDGIEVCRITRRCAEVCLEHKSVNLCKYLNEAPLNQGSDYGNLLIKGTGPDRLDTKLVAAKFWICRMNLVIENLAMYVLDTSAILYNDGDCGALFRNTYLQVSTQGYGYVFGGTAIHNNNGRVSVMHSKVEVNPPTPGISHKTGYLSENYVAVVIESEFVGFETALDISWWKEKYLKYSQLSKNDLTQNSVEINANPEHLARLAPNTPKGEKITIHTFIDILLYDQVIVHAKVQFKDVEVEGSTTIYRLPSAYPRSPNGFISPSEPQYYQFDSTAKLGKKPMVFFDKSVIDAKFSSSLNIVVMSHDGHKWKTLGHTVVDKGNTKYYRFSSPKKHINFVIAFFDDKTMML